MPGNNYAVLIGINEYTDRRLKPLRYAEKDCTDFQQLLTDRNLSSFARENVTVLTGANATRSNIERSLYKSVVMNRSADDRVLVYFSGHGFIAGAHDTAYLGTHDVSIAELLENPNQGLKMAFIHNDVLMKSPAHQVIFILDCCHSGALTPNAGSTRGAPQDLLGRDFFATGKGRIALFSCPPDSVCRESEALKNGIFTHFLLRGLRGEAIEPASGEVTIDSLLGFVRAKAPSDQPPGSCGQTYGRIVMTSPSGLVDVNAATARFPVPTGSDFSMTTAPLSNPLDPFVPFIDTLVARLQDEAINAPGYLDRRVLDILRQLSEAEFLFILRFDSARKEYAVKARSEIQIGAPASVAWRDRAIHRAVDVINSDILRHKIHHNVRCECDDQAGSRRCMIIIPLNSSGNINEYLIVYGIDQESPILNDAYCNILRALYTSTLSLTILNPKSIKAALLDNLKKDFSYMPLSMFHARLALFQQRLEELTIHFQPVLCLEIKSPFICGWEALARDPSTQLAPADIFQAAQLWGRQFLTELDICLARRALVRYRDALREAQMQRPHDIHDLSINAYPSSLMRTAYFRSLREAMQETGISGRNVVIEILEKEGLPEEVKDLKSYRSHLAMFSRTLQVTFGIDDFGVGHSSIERLAHLNVKYVKIDRELLHLESTEHAIRFVLDMVTFGAVSPVKVIVEGYDGTGKIELGQLHRLGIRYIQGYMFGKAGPSLYRMNREEVSYLEGLLKSAYDDRGDLLH